MVARTRGGTRRRGVIDYLSVAAQPRHLPLAKGRQGFAVSNIVLRKAVSHAALCSTSRRDRAALRTDHAENAAQAADGYRRLPRSGIFKGVRRP